MNAMMEASRHRIAEAKAADRSINIIIIYWVIPIGGRKFRINCHWGDSSPTGGDSLVDNPIGGRNFRINCHWGDSSFAREGGPGISHRRAEISN